MYGHRIRWRMGPPPRTPPATTTGISLLREYTYILYIRLGQGRAPPGADARAPMRWRRRKAGKAALVADPGRQQPHSRQLSKEHTVAVGRRRGDWPMLFRFPRARAGASALAGAPAHALSCDREWGPLGPPSQLSRSDRRVGPLSAPLAPCWAILIFMSRPRPLRAGVGRPAAGGTPPAAAPRRQRRCATRWAVRGAPPSSGEPTTGAPRDACPRPATKDGGGRGGGAAMTPLRARGAAAPLPPAARGGVAKGPAVGWAGGARDG